MAIKSVLDRNRKVYQVALGGDGYSSVTGKRANTGGTYANGIGAYANAIGKTLKSTIKADILPVKSQLINAGAAGGNVGGGVTREGVITGGMGVTKMPSITDTPPIPIQPKYAEHFSQAQLIPKTTNSTLASEMTAKKTTTAAEPQPESTKTESSTSKPASAADTPATYEEYLEQQKELLDKRKADADKQAEAAKERAVVDAQASYAQNMATYGANAESLAQMGLQGGGYSDYLNAQAYAQKRGDVQQANVTEQAAKAQNTATYEDAMAELNKGSIEYQERQQEKQEAEKQQQDSIYASLWERAIDPNSNYTEENIASLGKEYGLPDSQIEELKNVIKASKAEKNGNVYANLLGYANDGTYSAEQIAAIAKENGLSAQQIGDLTAAATTYKNNVYKTNYSSYMSSIESGSMTKNVLDTALKNDTITQEQYNDLLNKYQTSFYDTYSSFITSNFAGVDTDTIDKSLKRGEITQEQYDDLKKKYNASVASAITAASLFYQNGVKLDENTAKAMVQNMKNSGWLDSDNTSKIDTFLSDDYKEEDDGGGCYAKGTLITVADGSQVPVEDLKEGDSILVYNHYTGEIDIAPILFMYYEGKKEYDVLKLHFGEAADIEVLYGHGFFDIDLNKYVLIKSENVKDYIGHRFYHIEHKGDSNTIEIVSLTGYEEYKAETECYCAVSTKHLNCVANGILTIPDDQSRPPKDVIGFCNLFELDENHKIDADKMAADIEKYGIFSYEDFCQMAPDHTNISDLFFGIGGEYIKVAFGKGLLSMERLSTFIGIGADHRDEQNKQ